MVMCLGASGVGGGTVAPKVATKNRWLPTDAREPPWARKVANEPAICSATRSNSTSANVDERPRNTELVEAAATEHRAQAFDLLADRSQRNLCCPNGCPQPLMAAKAGGSAETACLSCKKKH